LTKRITICVELLIQRQEGFATQAAAIVRSKANYAKKGVKVKKCF